ncbi:MAG: transcriptional repressor LexA [Ectothiorhodospiraceae bacterium]|nr:transcriptional repressor LexA [Ectothiorhodospiraceae bacterium]
MLTPGQRKALDFIKDYLASEGIAPSLAEIAEGLGTTSRGSMHKQVQALAAAGVIRIRPGRQRGIELVDDEDTGMENALCPDSLPLLGRIAAGQPIVAIPDEETLNLTEFLLGPNRFALRVQGDSMIEAGILDGDTVIIRRGETAEDGDIVVALIDDDEATLKRFHRRVGGKIELAPENRSLRPMIFEDHRVRIQGVLVSQLRVY